MTHIDAKHRTESGRIRSPRSLRSIAPSADHRGPVQIGSFTTAGICL